MSEYWKSTPSYWCKFCALYVRDSPLERKNHESSGRHQNNIQRSLQKLHKDREREERQSQWAKEEVARLNGIVGGEGKKGGGVQVTGLKTVTEGAATGPRAQADKAAQRKAHAEQLIAMGVQLPEELRREVLGVGDWERVSETVVEGDVKTERSLADIIKQQQAADQESKAGIEEGESIGVRKRKLEDEEDVRDEEAAPKERKVWGSSVRRYPGDEGGDEGDLEGLLSGVVGKKGTVKVEVEEAEGGVKKEGEGEEKPLETIPDVNATSAAVKEEEGAVDGEAVAPVVFKKRKGKR
ncbi:hypothetical protein LTR09_005577 [Extremus antarcticus]|uniref:Matrin-type domain-containing protein n=1 Tax=Extremus antarcticus TaxID=702011 RepID=A0AAJ0DMQ4_9PEZI|nr:hypothetical protein LTR09_005577 [Extremus antarcticus]